MSEAWAKLLELLVRAAIALIPTIAGLIGGPLGWIAGKALAMLLSFVERAARWARIDATISAQVEAVKKNLEILKAAQKSGNGKTEALDGFKISVEKLVRFDTSSFV